MSGVLRRVEGGQLVAERQLVAVGLDDLADVVAFEGNRELDEGTAHRVARREGTGVVVDGDGFLEAGHHEDPVVRLPPYGALSPQPVVVAIRVVVDGAVLEEVDGLELAHGTAPLP